MLSTSRSGDSFWDIVHFVVQGTDQHLKPAEVECDSEGAIIDAVQTRFPNAVVIGCLFRLKHARRRAIQRFLTPEDEFCIAMTREVLDLLTVLEHSLIERNIRSGTAGSGSTGIHVDPDSDRMGPCGSGLLRGGNGKCSGGRCLRRPMDARSTRISADQADLGQVDPDHIDERKSQQPRDPRSTRIDPDQGTSDIGGSGSGNQADPDLADLGLSG
ncbi:hypothetical protein ON010_g7762 [Phytophthora cinnamomi]|nr:hypothetical protein ON010_g7762 [Phytophthora cinnamomi]